MKIINKTLIVALICSLSATLYAAGGGSMGGSSGGFQTSKRLTPVELAIKYYNQGIKYRDKAWQYEAEAAATDDDKRKTALLKKAQKQFVKAKSKFVKAVKKESRLYEAQGSLGYAYRRLGDYENALQAYDEALRLKPTYSEAIEYRAEAYLALGRLEETKTAYMDLFVNDRARADLLMAAMQTWSQTINVDNAEHVSFASWINQRQQLSKQTADLSQQQQQSWQP